MRPVRLVVAAIPLIINLVFALPCRAAAAVPNVIFILADDLGYGDLGVTFQNARDASKPKFTTPQLDRMAAEGMLLRQHYSGAPVCASARASLLLGQHQGHCPIRDNQFDKALPDNHTLATVLKRAGYHTVCIGKWGLQGPKPTYPGHPLRHGFDEFFGFLAHVSGHTYYHDAAKPLHEGFADVTARYADVYSTDLFTARAKKAIADQVAARPSEPFFLYLSYTAVHNPLQVPGRPYPAGGGKGGGVQWPLDCDANSRDSWIYPDFASATFKAADGSVVPWTEPMKRYATMVRRLDDGVGDVLALLRDLGIDRNTLVVFTSDNGPANEHGTDPRLFDSWGPFDGFKRDCWEGGVRAPAIAWWPGHVAANQTSDVISGFWDWMPTLADAARRAPPAQSDGVSLLPTLTGRPAQRGRGYLYVEYLYNGRNPASADVFARKGVRGRGQQQMVRVGDLVGIRTQVESPGDSLRLFNVASDPHQDHDLSGDPANAVALERMRKLLLTVRRPDAGAPRPYDKDLMPADAADVQPGGLDAAAFEGQWPWVPDFDALEPVGRARRVAGLDLSARSRDENVGIRFSGYLVVETAGEYTFHLASDSGAQMRIHDAHVIDDDFNHSGAEVVASVRLDAGPHPFRLFYRHGSGPLRLDLQYEGPGVPRRVVPPGAFATASHDR